MGQETAAALPHRVVEEPRHAQLRGRSGGSHAFPPAGVELDAWEGRTLASIVAFEFAEVRILNRSVPFHRDFEEMNLRFYVRRETVDGWRRGVVFVKELVPLPTVALLARVLYGEPYRALPMERDFRDRPVSSASSGKAGRERATTVRYSWRHDKTWNRVEATADTTARATAPRSGQRRRVSYGPRLRIWYPPRQGHRVCRRAPYVALLERGEGEVRLHGRHAAHPLRGSLRAVPGVAPLGLSCSGSPVRVLRPRVIRV